MRIPLAFAPSSPSSSGTAAVAVDRAHQGSRACNGAGSGSGQVPAAPGDGVGVHPLRLMRLSSAQGARIAILAAGPDRQVQFLPLFRVAGFIDEAADEAPARQAALPAGSTLQALAAMLVSASFDGVLIDGDLPAPHVDTLLLALHALGPREVEVIMILPPDHPPRQIARLLQAGADDYVSWPVIPVLLRAKIDAALRRTRHAATVRDCEIYGEYVFDLALHEVCMQRERVHLTPKEFNVALLLFRHQAQSLSRRFLQQHVWPHDRMLSTRTIDTHVSVVRAKLQLRPENGYRLKTVYGFGYRLERVSDAERRACAQLDGPRGTVPL